MAAPVKKSGITPEFGTEAEVIRDDETIPNTRAPYHIRLRLKVDASKRVQELAA